MKRSRLAISRLDSGCMFCMLSDLYTFILFASLHACTCVSLVICRLEVLNLGQLGIWYFWNFFFTNTSHVHCVDDVNSSESYIMELSGLSSDTFGLLSLCSEIPFQHYRLLCVVTCCRHGMPVLDNDLAPHIFGQCPHSIWLPYDQMCSSWRVFEKFSINIDYIYWASVEL